MKHLSLLLTVLILGVVPLTAAALDYGPNRPLLAAENGASPLPGTQMRDESTNAMPKPDVAETGNDDATDAPSAMPRTASPPPSPAATRRRHEPSAHNQPRSTPDKPAPAPGPASWQSLLPGSIQ